MPEHFERKSPAELGTSTRKDFLVAAFIFALGLDVRFAVAKQVFPLFVESKTRSNVPEFDPSKKVDEIETAMTVFGSDILSKLDLYVENPEMREKIKAVFRAFNDNLRNPIRARQEAKDVLVTRPIGFSYCFDLDEMDEESLIMSFSQLTRQLHLSPDIDMSDPGIMVFLSHELAHVEQDNEYRKSVPREKYMQFAQAEDLVLIPEDEAEAIAVQVEVANIVSGGALKTAVKNGQNNLPAVSRNPDLDKWLRKYVVAYYTRSEEDFVDFVKGHYSRVPGIKIFNTDLTPGE